MVSFWAKASLFAHPLVRAILRSSGSIPVYRNPNSIDSRESQGDGTAKNSVKSEALFHATFRTLDAGGTVGVFPEGTSYTEPGIVQVKDGAARVALEYSKWLKDEKDVVAEGRRRECLKVVPVGIVYTDKTRYQSRVCVRYGKAIDLAHFTELYLSSENENDQRTAIRALTGEIERHLVEVTINSPDWDTLHTAAIVRNILWGDSDRIPAQYFVAVSQTLIDLFSIPNSSVSFVQAKRALLAYHALLTHTRISHASLPPISASRSRALPYLSIFTQLAKVVVHLCISLPAFLPHLPAYTLGRIFARLFATPDAQETRAQYLAVGGILGAGLGYAGIGLAIAKIHARIMGERSGVGLGTWLACFWTAKVVLGIWHQAVVNHNYEQLQKLRTSFIVLLGAFSSSIPKNDLAHYTIPPPPPINPLIRHTVEPTEQTPPPPPVPARKLMRHVLDARAEAVHALMAFLKESEHEVEMGMAWVRSRCPILARQMTDFWRG
ncbi:hypothetical protein BKA93DRAFT_786646 [Sparassis latifolia]